MFENRRFSSILSSLFVSLLGAALVVSMALTSQGSAESGSAQYLSTADDQISFPDLSKPLPVTEYEAVRHFNYHIPSVEEIATTKQKLMKEEKFKQKAKKEGQEQAEKELDAQIKTDIEYMKEKNKQGSEKIPMLEIGEHSAYVSKYTYHFDNFQNCTYPEDPVNMFFYNIGYTQNVERKLSPAGWTNSDWPEDQQCAFASSTEHFSEAGLRPDTTQVVKNYSWWGDLVERDHMRMWEGGWSTGAEGWWSIGAVHHEKAGWNGGPVHCLEPYDPYGSSFDLGEWHVWNDALGYYPHFFQDYGNARKPDGTSWNNNCGYTVNHDGIGVGVNMLSDSLGPGEGLNPGMARCSQDLRFCLQYQTDGNLVLYQRGVGAIWATMTLTTPGFAIMQTDGNFVLYHPGWVPYWDTHTNGNAVNGLFVQNDGNVVIYRTNWAPIWWTGTCCR